MISLIERLAKINANRARLQATIKNKTARRQGVSYEQHKLVQETVRAIKAEMKLEKKQREGSGVMFNTSERIDRLSHDLETGVEELIAAFNVTPDHVRNNGEQIARARIKLEFLCSAILAGNLMEAAE